ncbi:peptidase domain-containing ABC transporter [Pseudomonas massiliensis]|uniref:peptidase domain-containing ABC transporter n=1 Tax=Pseudomonas massiliensis TaxID=522492 RepID=UPI000693438A|nr:type I secretion system permease/ATPase [Pseudomonas massiliensis]
MENNAPSLKACLQAIGRFHHCTTAVCHSQDLTWATLLDEANRLGLTGQYQRCDASCLNRQALPAIALGADGRAFIVAGVRPGEALIHDPLSGQSETLTLAGLAERWSGQLLLLRSARMALGSLARFDFTWFVAALVEHRKWLWQVLAAAFGLQLFALMAPLFFQAVMDKVLLHRNLHTLDILVIALVAVALLESALSAIRTYVLEHTAARIDAKLGSQLYRHLLALPLPYFQARPCGHLVARLGEVETLRHFLSAQTLGAIIDALFFLFFSAALFLLSPLLALVVLASLPLYLALALWLTPRLRQRLERQAAHGAAQQAFLLETLRGIDTVKTLAVEPQLKQRWASLQAKTLLAGFQAGNASALMQEAVGLVGKLTTAGVLGIGAWLVIHSSLSLGQLIAFNLLATRVAQPLQRLAQLWVHLQQAGIAMHRLADVLDAPREDTDPELKPMPDVIGQVEFREVHFRYGPGEPLILKNFNLLVRPGEVIGIRGPSGCGKSTLALLLQNLQVPERGQVLIDGIDLATVQPVSLRQQVGVVTQDAVLLSRSIRENIAINDPGAPLDEVMAAAKLAGAHQFILKLPQGYDTLLHEGGGSLSGGQRQRIALARALFAKPRLLIMDEATSALDAEAEQHILDHMPEICRGRTVLIIAHRAQALKKAGRVINLRL